MPTDVTGETTKQAKAGMAKGSEDADGKRKYGATFACHNATRLQWNQVQIKITGFKAGNSVKVQLYEVDAEGKPGSLIKESDEPPDQNGEATFNLDLSDNPIDADEVFLITIAHQPAKEKEVEYTVTIQPGDENGVPIS